MKTKIYIIFITVILLLSNGCTSNLGKQNTDTIEMESGKITDIKRDTFSKYLDYDIPEASIILDDSILSYLDMTLSEPETLEEYSLDYNNSIGEFIIKKADEDNNSLRNNEITLDEFIDKVIIANSFFLDKFDDSHFVFEFSGKRVSSSFSNAENAFIISVNNEIIPYGKNDISDAYVLWLYTNDDVYFICFE